jgi:two-component system, sensor histidine kinase and response regulator
MDPLRILIIEDSEGDYILAQMCFQKILGSSLGELFKDGIKLEWAQSISASQALLQESSFDLILLDLSLPDGFGLACIEKVSEAAFSTPIVVLSGHSDPELSLNAVKSGAQDYLVKGEITPQTLARSIRYSIERFSLVQELRRRNRELEAFTSVASHDLKSPLYKISEASELLRDAELTDNERSRFLEMIQRSARRLGTLIDDLLTFSSLGKGAAVFEDVDLNEIVDEVVSELEHTITHSQAEVTHEQLPVVRANRSGVSLLFQNLIANSIKYHGVDTPKIKIVSEVKGPFFRITVADNGKGIQAGELDRVFKPFTRGVGSEGIEGSGIGLATCARLVDIHDGRISAHSTIGEGTTMVVELPRYRRQETSEMPTPVPVTRTSLKPRVLVVEDDALQARTVTKLLEGQGYEVVTYLDPLQALRATRLYQFDCIVSDLMMPGISGEQLLQRVRRDSSVPVVIYSAMASQVKARMQSLGVFDCIEKGEAAEVLLSAVSSALESQAGAAPAN